MNETTYLFESLLEKASEYGKTSFELVKLKSIDKISESISSFIPHSIAFILFIIFSLFVNIGLAIWIGELLGKIYYGFFVTGGFYLLLGFIMHFALHKTIKNKLRNIIINQALN